MGLENRSRRKFAELVPNHVLGHIDRDVLPPVVNEEGMAYEIGRDHGSARPCLDGLFLPGFGHLVDLVEQFLIYEGSFF